jgi:hypothetical protein
VASSPKPYPYANGTSALAPTTGAVDVDLYGPDGEKLIVTDLKTPIELKFETGSIAETEDHANVDAFVPPRDNAYLAYQSFNISLQRDTVYIRFAVQDKSVQLLVFVRIGALPNCMSGDWDQMQLIPKTMNASGERSRSMYIVCCHNKNVI